jgi:hypothetical protein
VIADTLVEAGAAGTGGGGRAFAEAAQALAERLFERAPAAGDLAVLTTAGGPVLLVGSDAAVAAVLARAGLPVQPHGMPAGGTARVWTVQREAGPALAVITAAEPAALRALQRPLPHYGSQSWLVFDGPRASARGVWEAPGRVVAVEP